MEYHRYVPHKPKLTSVVMFTNVSYHKSAINPIHHHFSWLKSPFSHDFTMIFPMVFPCLQERNFIGKPVVFELQTGKDGRPRVSWQLSAFRLRKTCCFSDWRCLQVWSFRISIWDWYNDLFYIHIYIYTQYNTINYIY